MENGFKKEIEWARDIKLIRDPDIFFKEYVWVVINSGFKNKIAEKIYLRYLEKGLDAVNHKGKKRAIEETRGRLDRVWNQFQSADSIEEKLAVLQSLPWIGPITKYHLARNLGLDCAKPDRWLKCLAEIFGYKTYVVTLASDVQRFCSDISTGINERNQIPTSCAFKLGVVDVVLWRYCAENPKEIAEMYVRRNDS